MVTEQAEVKTFGSHALFARRIRQPASQEFLTLPKPKVLDGLERVARQQVPTGLRQCL